MLPRVLLSEQADFKEQQNAIQELVLSRGHFCIFLPKFTPSSTSSSGTGPASFAARRSLQRSRLSCRFSGASAVFPPRASAAPRRCCATAITMVASRRPLQRSRLQSALQSSSLSALQQVAGHCPRSAESLLRDGHRNGRVSAAVTTVAPTISLLTWVKCPASMLRDGHYNGSVAAAVTTVSPMQSCLHVVGLGRSTLWASIERACQSVPASRAEGELHQQG